MTALEARSEVCHIRRMETHIIKATLKDVRGVRVQLYYVTVHPGGDPLAVFDQQDATPDTTTAVSLGRLTAEEAASFNFPIGHVRNVADA